MDSFDAMRKYMGKEMGTPSSISKEKREARRIINRVHMAKGSDLREQAKNAGVSYDDYMRAQKLV